MLVQASSIRVAESFRVLFKMFVVFSPMKCPLQRRHRQRYNQLERRCENRLIRTILSRAIEAIKINSIRWSNVYICCSSLLLSSSTRMTGGFTLSDLLDKPWSQVSSLLPSGTCLQFLSRIVFSIPTAL